MAKAKKVRDPETGKLVYPWFDEEGNMLTKNGRICLTEKERREIIRASMNIHTVDKNLYKVFVTETYTGKKRYRILVNGFLANYPTFMTLERAEEYCKKQNA